MQNFRKKIEKTVINFANLISDKGLFKTIQFALYGNSKRVCLRETTWF